MKKKLGFVILAIVILAIGLAAVWYTSAPEKDVQKKKVNYDGIYFFDKGSGNGTAVRFFDDDTVIEQGLGSLEGLSPKDIVENLQQWFTKDYDSKGFYNIEDDKISFSIKSEFGMVDFYGNIIDDILILNWYSHINGAEGHNNIFRFIAFEE
jgi:hypothetical protein